MNKIEWALSPNAKKLSFKEREEELFKDFIGSRLESRNYKIKKLIDVKEKIISYKNKKIRLIGDYDVDGMTSVSEFNLLSKYIGLSDFDWTTPYRFSEGYGLSKKIIDRFLPKLEAGETGLVITVDNGIAAIEAIDYVKTLGWEVIVIDHHLPVVDGNGNKYLPNADIIIDPHAIEGSSNFDDYCGAGLVYKLAQTFIDDDDDPTMMKITSLACIGTIGDSVQLIRKIGGYYSYDNYLLVKRGLFTLTQNAGRTTGLYCLLRANGNDYQITIDNIGYTICPELNAPSRLNDDGSKYGVQILSLDDNIFSKGDELAQEMIACNDLRKKMCSELYPILDKQIEENHLENDYPMIVTSEAGEIHLGIVGIVAGYLSEKYQTAAIVCTPIGDGVLKGSARSPEGSDIKSILDGVSDLLLQYGGHTQAAGLSFDINNLEELRKKAKVIAGKKPEQFFKRYYDFEITPEEVSSNIEDIKKYAPYGKGHEIPVFKIKNYFCEMRKGMAYQILGKSQNVIKLFNHNVDAINFSGKGLELYKSLNEPENINLFGVLSENEWMGTFYPQIRFDDIEINK